MDTIDEKLNYLLANKIALGEVLLLHYSGANTSKTVDFNGEVLVFMGGLNTGQVCKLNNVAQTAIANTPSISMYSGTGMGSVWHLNVAPGDVIATSMNNNRDTVTVYLRMI